GGLSEELLKKLDWEVTIPMQDDVDSLNVAAASAVLLYGLTPA
ncbi:MAG: TrmH family RNA methyltransferase, partial [Myxococcota bacterium]|nr:TrmH family RNA methyltransferase [Myxococcota bacterium]